MDASQAIVSPLKNQFVGYEAERERSSNIVGELGVNDRKENSGGFIGVLEVFVHQARDIHNVCIYHKQDVYSKLCLTSNPEDAVSTETINGGGKNPVFNQTVRLDVRCIESSLKCEIWMLSRVKNYLEDQLLGFALVPLSEVLLGNGKLSQEFTLSSTELFHSPAGFVKLSLSYYGDSPEVVAVPGPRPSLATNGHMEESEGPDSIRSEYDKIEFPDPRIVNENNLMVSEYVGMQCSTLDSPGSESLVTDDHLASGIGVHVVASFSPDDDSNGSKNCTPTSSVHTNGSLPASVPASSLSSCSVVEPADSQNSDPKDKGPEVAESESESSVEVPSNTYGQSVLNVKSEAEQSVFQQEIVDMYMKSMQQFTESLAKMKLPMDIDNGTTNSGNASDQNLQASKATGSRVFYGSRAFF